MRVRPQRLTQQERLTFRPQRQASARRTLWAALGTLSVMVAGGCGRSVPLLSRMPKPPPKLLVVIEPPEPSALSAGITRARIGLPPTDSYRDLAEEIRAGAGTPNAKRLASMRGPVSEAVRILRDAIHATGDTWPSEPGGPECLLSDIDQLADALLITAVARRVSDLPVRDMEVCLDGLHLSAHVGMIAGPDADVAARRLEKPLLSELKALLKQRSLPQASLRLLASRLAMHEKSIKPLPQVLQEGLSIAAATARELRHDEWVATVNTMWKSDPSRDPGAALQAVWQDWENIIEAAAMPLEQAKRATKGMREVRDDIEYLFGPPSPDIIATRAEAMRALQRLRLMVALDRWRAARGSYPQRLRQLVPALIPAIPADPVSGPAFAYRRTGDSSYQLRLAAGEPAPATQPPARGPAGTTTQDAPASSPPPAPAEPGP